jgi:hypothetical protein
VVSIQQEGYVVSYKEVDTLSWDDRMAQYKVMLATKCEQIKERDTQGFIAVTSSANGLLVDRVGMSDAEVIGALHLAIDAIKRDREDRQTRQAVSVDAP